MAIDDTPQQGAGAEPRPSQRILACNLATGSSGKESGATSRVHTAEGGESDELSSNDEELPGQHLDNARRRYKLRRRNPVNYREARPYANRLHRITVS